MVKRDIEIKGEARIFSVGLLFVYALALAVVVLPAVLLWRSGEIWPARWIVANQMSTGAIWSAGLVADERAYKRALVKAYEPRVVVAGTSRVLGIRSDAFTLPFVNLGRGLDGVNFDRDLFQLADQAKPKILIWGIDHDLAGQRHQKQILTYRGKAGRLDQTNVEGNFYSEIIPRSVMTIWGLLARGQISPVGTLSLILSGAYLDGPRLGLRANLVNLGGYGPDGSYYYLDAFERPRTARDKLYRQLASLTNNPPQNSESVSYPTIARIRKTVLGLQRRGVMVVLFLTPLPSRHPVADQGRAYLTDLRGALSRLSRDTGVLFLDYVDARAIGIKDEEFIDAVHAGEVAMLKLLRDMSKHSLAVREVLRLDHIEDVIERHNGEATLASPLYRQLGLKRLESSP